MSSCDAVSCDMSHTTAAWLQHCKAVHCRAQLASTRQSCPFCLEMALHLPILSITVSMPYPTQIHVGRHS